MKIWVGQALIGNFFDAFAKNNKPLTDIKPLYIKAFVPRVVDYCCRHNYQYNLLTTSKLDFPHPKYECHAQKLWYLSQYEQYDYFLWLDIDILVAKKDVPEFPFSQGVTAVSDGAGGGEYFNTGVFGIDSKSAKTVWENGVIPLMEGKYKEHESDGMVDQPLINLWMSENNIQRNIIGSEWNTLVCAPSWKDRKQSNFIHYAGGQAGKYERVIFDLKKGH